ncbi:methyl-accepting chemotaxis protein [Paraburkholderia phytofirmans]|uniref:hypothetical protein n=1 Tax=Paraburkholderia phytofirmans TaxID=261302 RepID=UPI0038BC0F3E
MDATTFTVDIEPIVPEDVWAGRRSPAAESISLSRMTVKASLRMAFSLILMASVSIGLISIAQIWRVGNTAALTYTEGFASNRTVGTIRASVLRASRTRATLLSAATARERDDATEEISRNIYGAATAVAKMKRSPVEANVTNGAQQSELVNPVGSWSQQRQPFEKLIDDQPLYRSQMSWQVAQLETLMRAETDDLAQAVNRLTLRHEQNADAAIAQVTSICHSSLRELPVLTLALVVVTVAGNEWAIRPLARSLDEEPAYARSIAARIAQGDLSECVDVDAGASNSLLSTLSDMRDGLCSMAKRIATGSTTTSEASVEISQESRDLATRAENQAFKIGQPTSGMEVIAATVQQNAPRSSTASGLAVDALVDTIEEVNARSRDNQAQILLNLVSGFRTSVASGRSGRADHSQLGREIFEVPSSA